MNPKAARIVPPSHSQRDPAQLRKRFRIEKLEERIAPSKGGKGTHNCSGSSNTISGGCY